MKSCIICGKSTHPQALYCIRCRKLLNRLDARGKSDRQARVRALKKAWDGQCFRCHYTGVRLIDDNPKDPRYLTFDHFIPRKESEIVIVAAAINDMKSDMSDREFKRMVVQLANRFSGGKFDEKAFDLKYWKR